MMTNRRRLNARRAFLSWIAASPLLLPATAAAGRRSRRFQDLGSPAEATNVSRFKAAAEGKLDKEVFDFIAGGSDDEKTLRANRSAFDRVQIRARRLVDVSRIDTGVNVLGQVMETPILLAPVGGQGTMHPEGELASARAASGRNFAYIASTVSSFSIDEIRKAFRGPVWFQLYTTPDRRKTEALLEQAEAAGCPVVALTVDTPVIGNRESQLGFIQRLLSSGQMRLGNFDTLGPPQSVGDPALTWDFVDWLRKRTRMKIVIKGIVTHEDASICIDKGVDGLIVSNHGGRQEESGRGTLECLPEIVNEVDGRIAVLMDGGISRGTDIFKALALGADAVCIGRAYLWGLATFGQAGVEQVLDLMRAEMVRAMQLAGTPTIARIDRGFVASSL